VFDVIFREGSVSDMQLIRTGGDPIQKRSVASQASGEPECGDEGGA
jgi:hypothetical protein